MFRNKEIEKSVVLCLIIFAAAVATGFVISPKAGLASLIYATAFCMVFFAFTRERYKRIADMAAQIDRVLHHEDGVFISEQEEGELSILQDEIRKMTLRIREQNEALKRKKKNLADSLADLAHQLRTPLTSANLTLSFLKKDLEESERRELIRETEDLFAQMDWLLTSLLKLSRLDAGVVEFKKEEMAVDNMINRAIYPLQIPLELRGIEIHKEIPEDAILQGDIWWLSEAVQNILKNCMESVGSGGVIEIACEDNPLFTEITIHDSGNGFSKEDLAGLFERFYRGKDADTAGYGIGLALCRSIIMRQGGTVTAKNHPRGGAVFTIRFPK